MIPDLLMSLPSIFIIYISSKILVGSKKDPMIATMKLHPKSLKFLLFLSRKLRNYYGGKKLSKYLFVSLNY